MIIYFDTAIVVVEDQCHFYYISGMWNLDLLSELASLYNIGVPNDYISSNIFNFC